MDLAGKTVVVTGAASGIGHALAVEAAQRGAQVAAADLLPSDATVEAIRGTGGRAEAFICDITQPADVDKLARNVEDRFGAAHILAANAGYALQGSTDTATFEDFERVVRTNVLGTFACIRSFVPLLSRAASSSASGESAILITGSEHSLGVPPNQHSVAYTTSKHALLGLAEVARDDLAAARISVTLLCPGWTLTAKVLAFTARDAEAGKRIKPIAQTPETVASLGWDAVQSGTFLAVTNPATRAHALHRIEEIATALDRLAPR